MDLQNILISMEINTRKITVLLKNTQTRLGFY